MYEIWIRFQKGGNDQDLTLEIKALREDWDHITLSMFLYSVKNCFRRYCTAFALQNIVRIG